MALFDEKHNPPIWFIILGIIIVSFVAILVMLVPTHKYTQPDPYWLKSAQHSSVINNTITPGDIHFKIKLPEQFVS